MVLVLLASGCYAYRPLGSPPAPGTTVALFVTDVGRVSLGRQLGESARDLEADVLAVSDSGYVLGVRSVTYLSGHRQRWSNERLVVARQDVTNVRERRFSRARTIGATAVTVGSAVALIVTRSILAGGTGGDRTPPGGGGPPSDQ
jgi:hypothetical protein